MKDEKIIDREYLSNLADFSDDDDLGYEDLSAEEAILLSQQLEEESSKVRDSIIYYEEVVEEVINYIELRSPEDGIESPMKRKIKELVNEAKLDRAKFIEMMDGDNEQVRKMINTYPKKKDFKMEEFITWTNLLGYNIKLVRDPHRYELGEMRSSESDDRLVQFDQSEDFIPLKQMLVELINASGLKISNVKAFYSQKPTSAYNIIERFKKNNTMTTDTFSLWLTLIGYDIQLVKRTK